MDEKEITYKIRGAAFKVFNELGPGLLESVYEAAMLYQLKKDGLEVKNQVVFSVFYDGQRLPDGFRADILVENKIIIELKALEKLQLVHHRQLVTYLKISKKRIGFLINFGGADLKENLIRKIYG